MNRNLKYDTSESNEKKKLRCDSSQRALKSLD